MDELRIVRQLGHRYLFNRADSALERIRIVDRLTAAEPGVVFPSPIYEIKDIPAHSYVPLSDPDKHLDGAQAWKVRRAEWAGGKTLDEPKLFSEVKRWGGADFSEERVDREVRQIGHLPGRKVGEQPEEMEDVGKVYAKRIGVYRDTSRTLHLMNRLPVAGKRLKVKQHRYQRENGRWPDDQSEAEILTLEIRDMPAHSYVPVVESIDSNRERFEFELTGADWADGNEFRGARALSITNPVRSTPLEERDLTRSAQTVVSASEEKQ